MLITPSAIGTLSDSHWLKQKDPRAEADQTRATKASDQEVETQKSSNSASIGIATRPSRKEWGSEFQSPCLTEQNDRSANRLQFKNGNFRVGVSDDGNFRAEI